MVYVVRLKPSAEKKLAKLSMEWRGRVRAALIIIATNPYSGKKLKGIYQGHYVYRVWPYRIIYQIYKHELIVVVVRIGHRQGVY